MDEKIIQNIFLFLRKSGRCSDNISINPLVNKKGSVYALPFLLTVN